jgi:two-component system NarL family response regulator
MRLLLIEDDDAYQLAMAAHLQRLAAVEAVYVASDGEQGLELIQSEPIDLVLLDLVLPGMGGLATCRSICSTTALPVLILTSQEDVDWAQQMWKAGARGYLHKDRALEQVELAVSSLLAGASWWDQKATEALKTLTLRSTFTGAALAEERLRELTHREKEVLALLAAGDNNRAIAQQLQIGEGTVRSHVHTVLHKLQVSNRTQAALIWLQAE